MTKYFQTSSGPGATSGAGTALSPVSGKTLDQLLEIARTAANNAREERKKAEGARDHARQAVTSDAAKGLATEANAHSKEAADQATLAKAAADEAERQAKAVTAKAGMERALSSAAAVRAAADTAKLDEDQAKSAADAAQKIADTA